jgi:hypothetical protein
MHSKTLIVVDTYLCIVVDTYRHTDLCIAVDTYLKVFFLGGGTSLSHIYTYSTYTYSTYTNSTYTHTHKVHTHIQYVPECFLLRWWH